MKKRIWILIIIIGLLTGMFCAYMVYAQEVNDTVNGIFGGQKISPETQFKVEPENVEYTNPRTVTLERFAQCSDSYREGFFNGMFFGGAIRDELLYERGAEAKRKAWYKHAIAEGSTLFNDAFDDARRQQREGKRPLDYKLCDFVYYAGYFPR